MMIRRWINSALGRTSASLDDEDLLGTVATGANRRAGAIADPPEHLGAELDRARRYRRDLSIVVLGTAPLESEAGEAGDATKGGRTVETRLPHVVSLLAAAALRDVLRRSDVVCYRPTENHFVLALAESDADDARRALQRVRSVLEERFRLEARAGLARFPDEALTLDELVAKAAARAAGSVPASRSNGRGDGYVTRRPAGLWGRVGGEVR